MPMNFKQKMNTLNKTNGEANHEGHQMPPVNKDCLAEACHTQSMKEP